jgi:phenylpropionate dioxygenase-like ring-hydroxylating dioxygenase large terminal subunit
MADTWIDIARGVDLPCGAILDTVIDGEELVVWRSAHGVLCAHQRYCPHLDHDLTEAVVHGEELVCPAHGWSIAAGGRVFKRNEAGREDAKGAVDTWQVDDRDGMIALRAR